jgi:hypothetical protein
MKLPYSSPSASRNIWGRGGPGYPGIRITEGKIRVISNVQKIVTNFLESKQCVIIIIIIIIIIIKAQVVWER